MSHSASFAFTLQHIRHFVVLGQKLHFGRAADALNIAQPALSRSIQHLENRLGVALFARTNRRVTLTEAGAQFLIGALDTLATLERSVRHVRKIDEGTSGTLRIGYTDFAINGQLPEILKAFKHRFPDITIEPVHGVTAMQLEQLHAGTLDLGFVTGPIRNKDVDTIAVQDDLFVVVLYEGHPLCRKKEVALKDLAGERFVLGTPDYWEHFMDHLLRHCRTAGFEPDVVQHAYNTEGIFGLVACEMGITISTTAARKFQREELVVKPISGSKASLPTVCAWKPGQSHGMSEQFVTFLGHVLGANGSGIEPS